MEPTQAFTMAEPFASPMPEGAASAGPVAQPIKLVLIPSGMSVELSKPEVLVGRHSTADVCLPLGDVSRRHCRLSYHHGTWEVQDLGSLNGIFVNDRPVAHAVLAHRDRLRIGSLTFEVRLRGHGLGLSPQPLRRAS